MAEMKQLKLKSFTLVESLISLVLISLAVGFAFLVFSSTTANSPNKEGVYVLADELIQRMEAGELELIDQEFSLNNLEIAIRVDEYQTEQNLQEVLVRISKGTKVLHAQYYLILPRDES